MNSWTRVIVEWANCLGIVESTIESIHDLQDGVFYEELVSQLCLGNEENLTLTTAKGQNERDRVSKFIQAEYPDFGSVDCTKGIPEELYIASVLLVQCSQQPMFHRPMCVALNHETQIQIKHFLEMVLPCGKNLTRESVGAAIAELGDSASSDTPSTPKVRPLREFFNSPAVKSARSQRFMNERNRELICLRAQLETEQFEKADLMEDLKIQSEKICKLQKKLEEQMRELRELRMDRLKPPTPKSCRKTKRPSDNEERYRQEAESLETMNSELVSKIEKLEDEREELARRLTSSERLNAATREKYELSEMTNESLAGQLKVRTNELFDLRMHSEELRERVRQMQRMSIGEQSFDSEPVCNEALSSIVDIQLQEARKESSQLKSELAELKIELHNAFRDSEELRRLEIVLRDKTTELDSIQLSLRDTEEQLSSSNARAAGLELEKLRLSTELTKLGAVLREKDESLTLVERWKNELEFDLEVATSRARELEISLNNEKTLIIELKSSVEFAEREAANMRKILSSKEEQLSLVTEAKENLKLMLDEKILELRESNVSLENEKIFVSRLEAIVAGYKEESEDLRNKLAESQEQISLVNEKKNLAELNLRSIEKKLETAETSLINESARVEELKLNLVNANRESEDLKNLLKSNEELLSNERSIVEELKSMDQRGKKDYEDLQMVLEELKITLKNEKEGSNELREIVNRSKKSSEELESLLKSKDELLDETTKRQSSLNNELKLCKSRINDLETSLRSESSRCLELESQIFRAKKSCVDLEGKLNGKENLLKELEISKKDVETDLMRANVRIIEIQSNLEILRTKLSSVEEEKRLSVLANEKLEEYARDADEKIVDVEIKISNYERLIKNLNESLTEITKKLSELQAELNEKNSALDSMSFRLDEAEKRERATTDCLRSSEKKIAELTELGEEMESQMAQEVQKSTILRDENETLGEKLSSYVRSTSDLGETIFRIENELEKTRENLRKEFSMSDELRKKLELSRTINEQLEEKMRKSEDEFTAVLSERNSLKDELISYTSESSIMRQQIEQMDGEIIKCRENLARESSTREELTKKVDDLRAINNELEENLATVKNQFTTVTTERDGLREELDSGVREKSIMRQRLDDMEKELEKSATNLEKQIDANSLLNKRELESRETREKLHEELTQHVEKVRTLETEKTRLEEELSSFARARADMNEEISALHKEIEGSRYEQENIRELNDTECAKLRQRITELTEESELRTRDMRSVEYELREVKLENQRLSERNEISSNTVASLEKRLLVAENDREKIKLEDKLKEEALRVVRAKLEQLGKEKIETELKMNEVMTNLREVRSGQDQVLEAQVQALEKKSRQLVNCESQLNELTSSLVEKTSELESEKSRMKNVEAELEKLRAKSDDESRLVDELQRSLKSERLKNHEATENCESLRSKISDIGKVSKILKVELNALWDSVRDACPELARPREEIHDSDDFPAAEDVVASFVEDAKTIRKAVSILGEANETLKEHIDSEKETALITSEEAKKRKLELDERLSSMKNELEKRDQYLSLLARRKKDLQGLLSSAIFTRDKVDDELVHSMERWKLLDIEAQSFLTAGSLAPDDLESLRLKRNELDDSLASFNERHLRNSKTLLKSLCRIFLWSETKLHEAYNISLLDIKEEFSPEKNLSEEIERDEIMRKDLTSLGERMNEFSDYLKTYEEKLKIGATRASPSNEEKLQAQLEKISKERKEMKDKLDAARVRNAKMEKNMDELRNTNKKLKMEISEAITAEEREELERLRALTVKLEENKAELSRRVNDERDESRLETVHNEYGQKLEKIKQKMKTAYNEQMAKLKQEQEKVIKEKMDSLTVQMEQQCRKYTEDIAKYKAHITDLSSRYWDVGEKLLAETQEKQAALQQIQRLKGQQQKQEAIAEVKEQVIQNRQKTASLDRRDFTVDRLTRDSTVRAGYRTVEVIDEETTTFSTRRHSVKSIQAMGNAFKAEDEEGEVFDSVFLADLKEGRCAPTAPDFDRLSELRMRNSLCRPHLKSSYAVETNLQPVALNEDDIKNGVTGDDVFNDSLSQSLLPGQKPKRKDRTQTSYKRPGPPTPSKNGGRLSLQGNELKSPNSRILKERNVDRRTTATPRGLKNLFGASMSKRQDENTVGTPKGRRLSNIFRKQRTERN